MKIIRQTAMPIAPSKPNKKLVLAAAAVLALLLGIFAAVLRDLRSRRVFERWQVERQLGLAVIGDVQLP